MRWFFPSFLLFVALQVRFDTSHARSVADPAGRFVKTFIRHIKRCEEFSDKEDDDFEMVTATLTDVIKSLILDEETDVQKNAYVLSFASAMAELIVYSMNPSSVEPRTVCVNKGLHKAFVEIEVLREVEEMMIEEVKMMVIMLCRMQGINWRENEVGDAGGASRNGGGGAEGSVMDGGGGEGSGNEGEGAGLEGGRGTSESLKDDGKERVKEKIKDHEKERPSGGGAEGSAMDGGGGEGSGNEGEGAGLEGDRGTSESLKDDRKERVKEKIKDHEKERPSKKDIDGGEGSSNVGSTGESRLGEGAGQSVGGGTEGGGEGSTVDGGAANDVKDEDANELTAILSLAGGGIVDSPVGTAVDQLIGYLTGEIQTAEQELDLIQEGGGGSTGRIGDDNIRDGGYGGGLGGEGSTGRIGDDNIEDGGRLGGEGGTGRIGDDNIQDGGYGDGQGGEGSSGRIGDDNIEDGIYGGGLGGEGSSGRIGDDNIQDGVYGGGLGDNAERLCKSLLLNFDSISYNNIEFIKFILNSRLHIGTFDFSKFSEVFVDVVTDIRLHSNLSLSNSLISALSKFLFAALEIVKSADIVGFVKIPLEEDSVLFSSAFKNALC